MRTEYFRQQSIELRVASLGAFASGREATAGNDQAAGRTEIAGHFEGRKPDGCHSRQNQHSIGFAAHLQLGVGRRGAGQRLEIDEIKIAGAVKDVLTQAERHPLRSPGTTAESVMAALPA